MSTNDYMSLLAHRGSCGLRFIYGPPREGSFEKFPCENSTLCRDMAFTRDGSLFAWCNGQKVKVLSMLNFQLVCEIDRPRTSHIAFSPKGTCIATWEPYVVQQNPQESCNLHIWNVEEGKCLKSFIQKKPTNWCPEWTNDENICARNVSNEVHFFEAGNFGNIAKKIFMQKVAAFSLASSPPDYYVACYVPGIKGQPSFVRLFKYPKFEGASSVIAQKSFFKADKADFYWNKNGKDLIVQSTVDVDKSGGSYYGEQNLYYLSVKGDTAKIMLGKDGPIYSVMWSPNSQEFCVVYGYMPAKATIYNLKCEAVFDFGTGPRNEVHYNVTGNRLILCGFGNLRGHVEVWDVKDKKKISNFTATDSTCLLWSPDGETILTATTSPRLRIGNGYRVWHYTGSLLCEKFIDIHEELWDIQWLPVAEEKVKEKATQYMPVPGIQSAQPQASKQVYRPPGARGQPSAFKLHDHEPPKDLTQNDLQNQQPMSKNKKKNLAKKAKREQEKDFGSKDESKTAVESTVSAAAGLTTHPEKDKRIKSLLKKLDQIQKLKEDQKKGKILEKNQEEKIKKEDEIIEELKSLEI